MRAVQHQEIEGLELIRGRVVNIVGLTGPHSEWYRGRALDGGKEGLLPCNFVRTNEEPSIKCEISQLTPFCILTSFIYPVRYTTSIRNGSILGIP